MLSVLVFTCFARQEFFPDFLPAIINLTPSPSLSLPPNADSDIDLEKSLTLNLRQTLAAMTSNHYLTVT